MLSRHLLLSGCSTGSEPNTLLEVTVVYDEHLILPGLSLVAEICHVTVN